MKKTFCYLNLIYIFLFPACLITAQTQPWKKLQSPVDVTLRYLCFVDSLTGWAAGELGTIIRTSDGGINWEVQNSTIQTFITDIFFIDKNLGWAITINDVFPFNSVIIKTTNGGSDWVAENFQDTNTLLRTIFFFDSLNGFVGGSYIAHTSNGGSDWTRAEVDSNMISNFPVYKFNFLDRKFGYACGGRLDVAGVVWRTTDYGLNWAAQGISADEVFDIFIFDSLNAITLSGDPEGRFPVADLKTTDAGITWNYTELPFFGLSFAIDFRTYNEGWSASGYKFFLTTNRGETWGEFETPDSTIVYDLQFADARTGYAVGEDGVILKFSTPPDTTNKTPIQFMLYQNYPNPFNSGTVISYQLPVVGDVTLIVYDVLGNEIATLVNEEKPPGDYEVEFSSEASIWHLVSGIYFYQLRVDDCIQTKKMLYLK